jgi:hypothetical protein
MYFPFTFRVRGKFNPAALSRRRQFLVALQIYQENFEGTVSEYWKGEGNIAALFPTATRVSLKQLGEPRFSFKRNFTFSYEVDYAIVVLGTDAIRTARANYPRIREDLLELFGHIERAMEFDDFSDMEFSQTDPRRYFRPLDLDGTHKQDPTYTQDSEEFPYMSITFPDPFVAATRKNIRAREMERVLQGMEQLPPGLSRILAQQVAGPMRAEAAPRSRPLPEALRNRTLMLDPYTRFRKTQKAPAETRRMSMEGATYHGRPLGRFTLFDPTPPPAPPTPAPRTRWQAFRNLFRRRGRGTARVAPAGGARRCRRTRTRKN